MKVEKSIEATIMDYVRFFPEEVQGDYAAMLQRCNFHDATDPCFPIMLFLLFFQESICEKVEQLDQNILETQQEIRKKQIVASAGAKTTPGWFRILLILLLVLNLALSCGWIVSRASVNCVPKNMKISENTERNQLQEMNRYWIEKLEEDERGTASVQHWNWLNMLAVSLVSSAFFSMIVIMPILYEYRKRKNFSFTASPRLSGSRKKRIFQLFSRIVCAKKQDAVPLENKTSPDSISKTKL